MANNDKKSDVWIKNVNKTSSLEFDESLTHSFGDLTVKFLLMYPISNKKPETTLSCFHNGYVRTPFDVKGGVNTAKELLIKTVNHFDHVKKCPDIADIESYLSSKTMDHNQLTNLKQPNDLKTIQAKKAGYVQGVCECVTVVTNEVGDRALANKLLSEMKVTRAMAKKYADPETYKGLEQSVFAPKLVHTRERGRHR